MKNEFIPVAIDQWYERRQKDSCGDFYRKIMNQGSRRDFEKTTQGKYAVAPDGTLLGETNHRDPQRILKMIETAQEKFEPQDTEGIVARNVDQDFARILPDNASVVRVHAKVLGGYEEPKNEWQRIFQNAVARDNLWILAEEAQELSQGSFPKTLGRRLAQFNLVDNTRGEPPMWAAEEVTLLEIKFNQGVVRGKFRMESTNKSRGFEGELFGHIEATEGKLERFDLVANGTYWGEGRYTPGAPEGKFPIAMAFELGDGRDAADQVAPQGTKGWLPNYWQIP
ncbi:hypothetical protein OAG68_00530 [bacterium]|nr:hypothetical protein [bacterium]